MAGAKPAHAVATRGMVGPGCPPGRASRFVVHPEHGGSRNHDPAPCETRLGLSEIHPRLPVPREVHPLAPCEVPPGDPASREISAPDGPRAPAPRDPTP